MADRKYYVGSHGPYYYDDADPIDDPDGDFLGETRHGLSVQGQILVETGPTQPEHAIRQGDMPGGGGGVSGGPFTILTAIQVGGIGAHGVQYRTRALTFTNGILTTLGAESAWNDF